MYAVLHVVFAETEISVSPELRVDREIEYRLSYGWTTEVSSWGYMWILSKGTWGLRGR